MLDYNTMGACVLVLTLVSVFVMVILIRKQRTGKDIAVWLMSGLTGILLGFGAAAAVVQLMGYDLNKKYVLPPEVSPEMLAQLDSGQLMAGGGGGNSGGGSDSESESGSSPSGMGMMMGMGGGGGARGPSPKRELTTLVRKVDLLTGDIALGLSAEQTAALGEILVRIQAQESMTDDQATAAREEILALLDESQKAKQDAIGLPFGRGGGGRGGPGGAPADGEAAQENANPFVDEQNAAAIQSLLERFGSGSAASEPPAEAANEAGPVTGAAGGESP